jgi:hypothetical protein
MAYKNLEKWEKWKLNNRLIRSKKRMEYEKTRDNGLYSKYRSAIARCRWACSHGYKHYGGKGIQVDWLSYEDFKKDMQEDYIQHLEKYGHKQTTLDRIDSGKNYSKENCRWATWIEQNNSKHKKLSTLS